jgi:hypothetical protein
VPLDFDIFGVRAVIGCGPPKPVLQSGGAVFRGDSPICEATKLQPPMLVGAELSSCGNNHGGVVCEVDRQEFLHVYYSLVADVPVIAQTFRDGERTGQSTLEAVNVKFPDP